MNKQKSKFLIAGMMVIGLLLICGCAREAKELTLQPDHLEMLVNLDGEWDEYYEELTLECDGKRVDGNEAEWYSEDPEIAEVDEEGWVTSMGVGKTTITVRYKGASAQCTVKVTQKITSDTLGE